MHLVSDYLSIRVMIDYKKNPSEKQKHFFNTSSVFACGKSTFSHWRRLSSYVLSYYHI